MIKHILIFLFLLLNMHSYAQKNKLYVSKLTRDNGLASNRINCIFEDKTGVIWFGTQDGLNMFAGYNISTFRHNPNDTTSIGDNRIYCIVEEEKTGNFWIGTENGLNYFNRDNNSFKRYFTNTKDTIFTLIYDKRNTLWIGTTSGLYKYNSDNTFSKFTHEYGNVSSVISNRIYALHEDKKGNFWVGTDIGLDLFDKDSETFTHHTKTSNLKHIRYIFSNSDNDLWIGTYYRGLFRMKDGEFHSEMKNYTKENGYLLNNRVQSIIEDEFKNLYIADRDGGLIYYDIKNDKVIKHIADIYNPSGLNSKALRTMIKSSTGIIWIGTYNSGVNYIDANRKPFKHYKINYKADGLFNNNTRSMFQDSNGNIWIGTKENGGISLFNRTNETFKHYLPSDAPGALKDDYIFTINEIDKRYLIIGTYKKGIAIFDKLSEKFTHLQHDKNNPESISSNLIYATHKDQSGKMWIGTFGIANSSGFLNLFDPKTRKVKVYRQITQVRCFCDENQKKLWLGTLDKGLFLFNKVTEQVTQYNKDNSEGLKHNNITSLKKDSNGNLWIGTDGGGLCFRDKVSGKFKTYTTAEGLPNNRIFAIQIDAHNNVWISTANGLSKFSPEKEKFRNFDIYDGLQGNEFESYVSLKTKKGEMLFGGRNGFNLFHPDSIKINENIPNVLITGLKLFHKQVTVKSENSPLKKQISRTKKLTLNHKQSVITFEFIALNYSSPEKNQYAYKLEGFDKEWNYIGNKREATYTNLPKGEYIFRVKASNNDGVWNEKGTSIQLKILPPWWKTWWFRILLVIVITSSILSYYFFRISELKKYQKVLEETVRNRTIDLSDANQELIANQEEIRKRNIKLKENEDHLIDLNQELSAQKEELEATLEMLKDTQSQLIQSEKMASVGTLTAGIAHEINNPLNFIQGGKTAIDIYIRDKLTEEQNAELLPLIEIITKGIDRASNIVLSLNRFNKSTGNYDESCKIKEILDNCLTMLNSQISGKIDIVKLYENPELIIKGNEGELHQVFINILTNSIQAIENSGAITIKVKETKENAVIEISDTGHGISPEYINKVTVPFFTTKDPSKGTGLGLSIAYSIIKRHNGSVKFESNVNEGTKVTLNFPINT